MRRSPHAAPGRVLWLGMPHLFATILTAASPVLLALLAWMFAALARLITVRTSAGMTRAALLGLDDLVSTVVRDVAQTYVDDIKRAASDGKITSLEAAKARDDAFRHLTSYLGRRGLTMLERIFGVRGATLDALLKSRIEAEVHAISHARK